MLATRTAGAIVLILSLAACSGPSGSMSTTPASATGAATSGTTPDGPTTGPATTPTTGTLTGTLTGLVRLYGGPLNPTTGKMALNGSPGPDWTVTVMSGARTAATGKSDKAGRFRFELAPGPYTLACGQEPRVVVIAGQTVVVDCDVPVP